MYANHVTHQCIHELAGHMASICHSHHSATQSLVPTLYIYIYNNYYQIIQLHACNFVSIDSSFEPSRFTLSHAYWIQ